MATHSSVLAWRIPGPGEPGGLPSMGSHKVGHNWGDLAAVAAAACRLYKELFQFNNEKTETQFKSRERHLSRHFSREDRTMANKHKRGCSGTSLLVQGLGRRAPRTGGAGAIPGWGTRIPHAMQHSQKGMLNILSHYENQNHRETLLHIH